ncbi:MAG: TadE/TadG family type IV pilus assembly protein [Candidatus Brocadiales bacterium]
MQNLLGQVEENPMLKYKGIYSVRTSAADRWKDKRGAVAVEFAIVLLVLMLTVFGTIEFGWAFFTKAVVTNAAREGSRLAVTPSAADATIVARVESYLDNFLLNGPRTIEINPSVSPGPPPSPISGTPVTVTVTYNYSPLTVPFVASDDWTIVATAAMRRE